MGNLMAKIFGANWKTTVSGFIALATGAIALKPSIVDFIPQPWNGYIVGASNFIVFASGGAFALVTKDRNVTGGIVQQTVSGAVAKEGTQTLVDETVKSSVKSGEDISKAQAAAVH
jgi:hypothetical protein